MGAEASGDLCEVYWPLTEIEAERRFVELEEAPDPEDLKCLLDEPGHCCPRCGLTVGAWMTATPELEKELWGSCCRCGQEFGEWAGAVDWWITPTDRKDDTLEYEATVASWNEILEMR